MGLCLPKECDQDIMNSAGTAISNTLMNAVNFIRKFINIWLIEEYYAGMEIRFYQPDNWSQKQVDEKGTTASVISGVMLFVIGISVIVSILKEILPHQFYSFNHQNNKKDYLLLKDDMIRRDSTKPFTIKFMQNSNDVEGFITNDTCESPGQVNLIDQKLAENSLFDNSEEFNFKNMKSKTTLLNSIAECFSIKKNLLSLARSKRNKDDHEELDIIEGIKVLSMCWGLISCSSLYLLVANLRNVMRMFKLFQLYLFPLIFSGYLAPDIFMFSIYFYGFIKLNQFYDKNNGIGPKDYLKIFLHRLLKLAPLYYIVFFAGWFIVPLLSNSASWYVSERLFWKCESEWYYVLLFINNLVPFFTNALEGCYYWPYIISNDILLYTMFPLWIIIYRKHKNCFYALNAFFLIFSVFIAGWYAYEYNLKVGILSIEDYNLFAYQFNKPFMKFGAVSLGMLTGNFYLRLLEYRKSKDEVKKTQYKWIHIMSNSLIVTLFLYAYGIGMLSFVPGFIKYISYSAFKYAYAWTRLQNTAFFAFSKIGYITSVIAFMLVVFLGKGETIKFILSLKLWIPISKLSFGAYLVYPIPLALLYYATNSSIIFMFPTIVMMCLSAITVCYLIGCALHVFFDAPIANIFRLLKIGR